jgi:hypothetical protein
LDEANALAIMINNLLTAAAELESDQFGYTYFELEVALSYDSPDAALFSAHVSPLSKFIFVRPAQKDLGFGKLSH